MNQVGKPDAGNPHVRFDERRLETGSRLPRQPSTLLMGQAHIAIELDEARGMRGVDARHQVLAEGVALLQVRVVVGDDLREEVVHPEKGAQVLAELVGLLLGEPLKAVGGRNTLFARAKGLISCVKRRLQCPSL